MDASRFDRIAKRLADRPLNRRAALAAGGGGLGAALLGLVGKGAPSVAQDATPAASPVASPVATPITAEGFGQEFLFVQAFESGTWVPKPGENGVYLLTLSGHAAQTVYFSDRPQRITGTVSTIRFLDALGFTPDNPPNAALVVQTDTGAEDVLVVELFDPVYTESFAATGGVSVTYEARVLVDYQGAGLQFLADRQGDAALPAAFGPTSLFIDDCPDATFCGKPVSAGDMTVFVNVGPIPGGPYEKCWYWDCFCCSLCSIAQWQLNQFCNDTYPTCEGRCQASS